MKHFLAKILDPLFLNKLFFEIWDLRTDIHNNDDFVYLRVSDGKILNLIKIQGLDFRISLNVFKVYLPPREVVLLFIRISTFSLCKNETNPSRRFTSKFDELFT